MMHGQPNVKKWNSVVHRTVYTITDVIVVGQLGLELGFGN